VPVHSLADFGQARPVRRSVLPLVLLGCYRGQARGTPYVRIGSRKGPWLFRGSAGPGNSSLGFLFPWTGRWGLVCLIISTRPDRQTERALSRSDGRQLHLYLIKKYRIASASPAVYLLVEAGCCAVSGGWLRMDPFRIAHPVAVACLNGGAEPTLRYFLMLCGTPFIESATVGDICGLLRVYATSHEPASRPE
jgi:hypothetical protein